MPTILVCVDFSEATQRVIDTAKEIARLRAGKLHLVHIVTPLPPAAVYDPIGVAVPDLTESRARQAKADIETWAQRVRESGGEATTAVLEGGSASTLVEEAKRVSAAMIVLGSHGHGALYHLLLGSTTLEVLRRAECPVVIVPARMKTASPAAAEAKPTA